MQLQGTTILIAEGSNFKQRCLDTGVCELVVRQNQWATQSLCNGFWLFSCGWHLFSSVFGANLADWTPSWTCYGVSIRAKLETWLILVMWLTALNLQVWGWPEPLQSMPISKLCCQTNHWPVSPPRSIEKRPHEKFRRCRGLLHRQRLVSLISGLVPEMTPQSIELQLGDQVAVSLKIPQPKDYINKSLPTEPKP